MATPVGSDHSVSRWCCYLDTTIKENGPCVIHTHFALPRLCISAALGRCMDILVQRLVLLMCLRVPSPLRAGPAARDIQIDVLGKTLAYCLHSSPLNVQQASMSVLLCLLLLQTNRYCSKFIASISQSLLGWQCPWCESGLSKRLVRQYWYQLGCVNTAWLFFVSTTS